MERFYIFSKVNFHTCTFTIFAFGHGLNRWDFFMPRFRMRGLDPDAVYECEDIRMTGAALMSVGVNVQLMPVYRGCDYVSKMMTFRRVE